MKRYRRKQWITQLEAGKEIGISQSAVYLIERGRRPKLKTVLKICKWMKIGYEWQFIGPLLEEAGEYDPRLIVIRKKRRAIRVIHNTGIRADGKM